MKLIHQVAYALSAALMLVLSSVAFSLAFDTFPKISAHYDPEGLHIIQEASSAVFAGPSGWLVRP